MNIKKGKKGQRVKEKVDVEGLWGIWKKNGPDIRLACEICSLLKENQLLSELEMFLESLPAFKEYEENEMLNRCRVCLAFWKKDFGTVYKLLQEYNYTDAEDLIKIWDAAHYHEEEKKRFKPLTPLSKFRIRQRHMPPRTICPSGIRLKATLPKEATSTLRNWLDENLTHPYPNRERKLELAHSTGLSKSQVNTWFANARRRLHRRYRARTHPQPPGLDSETREHETDDENEAIEMRKREEFSSGTMDSSHPYYFHENAAPGHKLSLVASSSSLAWPLASTPSSASSWMYEKTYGRPTMLTHGYGISPAPYHAVQQRLPQYSEAERFRLKADCLRTDSEDMYLEELVYPRGPRVICTQTTPSSIKEETAASSSSSHTANSQLEHTHNDAAQILVDLSNNCFK